MLREQHKSLAAIYREVRADGNVALLRYEAMSYMSVELAPYMAVHDNVQLLELGAEDLIHGHLTPRLVEVGTLDDVLRKASEVLHSKGLELSFTTPTDVYVAGNFDFIRRVNNLSIRLSIPYA